MHAPLVAGRSVVGFSIEVSERATYALARFVTGRAQGRVMRLLGGLGSVGARCVIGGSLAVACALLQLQTAKATVTPINDTGPAANSAPAAAADPAAPSMFGTSVSTER